MRIKILRTPNFLELEGMDLQRFQPGHIYEVGNCLGAVMLAEGWAAPVADDAPALLIPFSESDPYASRVLDRQSPPNLVREVHPPSFDEGWDLAADFARRRGRRRRH